MRQLTATSQGILVVGSDASNYRYGLDCATGKVVWSRSLAATAWSPPAVAGSTLYDTPHDQTLWALRVETGEPLWWLGPHFPSLKGFSSRADLNRASAAPTERGLVTVSLLGVLSLLDKDGKILAQSRLITSADRDQFWSRPVVLGGRVLLASTRGNLWSVDLDAPGRMERRSLGVSRPDYPSRQAVLADPLALGDRVVVATLAGLLHCLTARGEPLWSRAFTVDKGSSSARGRLIFMPVAGPGTTFLVATQRQVYCLDNQGRQLWSRAFPEGVEAPPAWSADMGIVVASAGQLSRLDSSTGQLLTRLDLSETPTAGPTLWGTSVLLGFADGRVESLRLP